MIRQKTIMKLLTRPFTQGYPYLAKQKFYHKVINDFPLAFNSSLNVLPKAEYLDTDEEKEGIAQMYKTYINALVSGDLDSLDTLVEYNMIYRTNVALNNLKEKGFSLHLAGEGKVFEISCVKKTDYAGSLLPLRNLNFPSEFYDITKTVEEDVEAFYYVFKSLENPKDFSSFEDLDLELINKADDLEKYREKISSLLTLMNQYFLIFENFDIAINTDLKIVVKNEKGEIVAGKDDNEPEFHVLRIELCEVRSPSIFNFFKKSNWQFLNTKFKNFLNQYTIVDIDGFMNKNLIIPHS